MSRKFGMVLATGFIGIACVIDASSASNLVAPTVGRAATNLVVIKVQVIPKCPAGGTNQNPWNVQIKLCQQDNGGGEHSCISNRMCVANNNGQVTFKVPVVQTHSHLMTYRVTCIGGTAYSDESSPYFTATQAAQYNISLNMIKRQ
jgi:hypothetical protein